jgi:hypothetical protein
MTSSDCKPTDEVFTHIDELTGVQATYNATQLRAFLEQSNHEIVLVPVDEAHATYCMENRGIEPARLLSLMQSKDAFTKPLILASMPDGSSLLVDGTHRFVLAHTVGLEWMRAYLVANDVAAPFLITDAPEMTEAQLREPSGLDALRKVLGHQ